MASDWYSLGKSHHNKGKLEKAIEYYNKALTKNPRSKEILFNLVIIFRKLGWHWKTRETLERLISIDPRSTKAWYHMGMTYFQKKEFEQGIRCFERVLDLDPQNKEMWNNLGNIYNKIRRYKKANNCYKNAIKINPQYKVAWYNMGHNYNDLKNPKKMIECFEKVVEIDPTYKQAWYNLGIAYSYQQMYESAIECYEKILEINPDYKHANEKLNYIKSAHPESWKRVQNRRQPKYSMKEEAKRKRERLLSQKFEIESIKQEEINEKKLREEKPKSETIKSEIKKSKVSRKLLGRKKKKVKSIPMEKVKKLTKADKLELERTEKEMQISKPMVKCLVHRGEIHGNLYLCPKCQSFYCDRCAKVLKLKGEACWSCGTKINVKISEKDRKELLD